MIWRGQGWWVGMLFLSSIVFMLPARTIGIHAAHMLVVVWLLASGAYSAWYGWRSFRRAAEELGRPLRPYEYVVDPVFWKPMPFHSFMLIQMPWWAIAFVLASAWLMTM